MSSQLLQRPLCRMIGNIKKPIGQGIPRTVNSKPGENVSTIDPKEVEAHEKLALKWWDPDGPMKALHSYNDLRVPFIRNALTNPNDYQATMTPLKSKKILDIGCGGGILTMPLARLGASVTGIDPSPTLCELAKSIGDRDEQIDRFLKPQFLCTSIEEHANDYKNYYDGVIASEVIEHVDKKELFVQKMIEVCKPGGKLIFTTPNRTKLAQFGVIWFAENVLKLVPKGTHNIEKFITPQELTFLIERNGGFVEMTHAIIYNPLTNRWAWSVNYNFAYALQAVKR